MTLQIYIDAWREAMRAITQLDIDEQQAQLDTSLPGWNVHDIIAHLVHLEEVLAFGALTSEPGGASEPPGAQVTGAVSSDYTQAGVDLLADASVSQLFERLDAAVAARAGQLNPPPADAHEPADRTPGGIEWDWSTLLRNRAIDAWVHEQDIRRVIGAPGGLDTTGAAVTIRSFASALPFVVGKRARVPQGHPVRFEVSGPHGFSRTIAVGADGRATDTDAAPLTTVAMSSETFARLAAGRESVNDFEVQVTGDTEIATRIFEALAITP